MSKFEGFGPISRLYVKNYELVRAMEKHLEEDYASLFLALEETLKGREWFTLGRDTIYAGKNYFRLIRQDPREGSDEPVLHLRISVEPWRLVRGTFQLSLRIVGGVTDVRAFKTRFHQKAGSYLEVNFTTKEYSSLQRADQNLVVRDVQFELEQDNILEAIVKEIENFEQLLPYADQALIEE